MKRLLKIAIVAAIIVGIAVVVKKLTAAPDDSSASLEPWPPLTPDTSAVTDTVKDAAEDVAEAAEDAASDVAEAATPSSN